MTLDINVAVLVGQFVLAGVLVWIALRKAPKERIVMDATTAAQYAQAAKLKGEENAALTAHIDKLEARLQAVENKKFKVCIEFVTGDPPEVLKAEIAQVMPVELHLKKAK